MKPFQVAGRVGLARWRRSRLGSAAVLAAVAALGAGAPAVALAEAGTIVRYPLGEALVREADGQSRGIVAPDTLPPVGTQVEVRQDGGVLIPGENGAYIDSNYVDVERAGNSDCVDIARSGVAMGESSAIQAGSPGVDGGCR